MDIAHTVASLNAHVGVLDAEISRIDADIASLEEVTTRYPADSPLAASVKKTRKGLDRLKVVKQSQLKEAKQQIELFRLHLPAAQKLLKQLNATQKVELPEASFPGPNSNVNALVYSQILSAEAPQQQQQRSQHHSAMHSQTTVVTPARARASASPQRF
jgi:hypothetical protein